MRPRPNLVMERGLVDGPRTPARNDRKGSTTLGGIDARAKRICNDPAEAVQLPRQPDGWGCADRPPMNGATPWPHADRDLLFGLLALQNGLIDQGQLVAAFQAWTRDKARPLADHLVARGDLDAERPSRRRGARRPST